MICVNCGYENADGSKFCKNCGTKLPEKIMPKFCRVCGKGIQPGALYCVGCGQRVEPVENKSRVENHTPVENKMAVEAAMPVESKVQVESPVQVGNLVQAESQVQEESPVQAERQVQPEKQVTVAPQNAQTKKKGNGLILVIAIIIAIIAIVVGVLCFVGAGKGDTENQGVNTEQASQTEEIETEDDASVGVEESEEPEDVVEVELSDSEYQSLCKDMMDMNSAYGSRYEEAAIGMAQTMVSAKIASAGTSYGMKNISSGDLNCLVYRIAERREFPRVGSDSEFFLNDYREQMLEEGYDIDYMTTFDKNQFVALVSAFSKDVGEERVAEQAHKVFDKYLGFWYGDGDPWEYFDAYDIKENDDYVLIHAACYTGNNGGGENIYLYTINALFEKTEDSVLGLQAVYVEGYENDINEHIISCIASSELPNYKEKTYKATNLIDGDYSTPWVENVSGVGVGEYIQIKLDKSAWVQEFVIYNGYQESEDLYEKNGRVERISVDFGNGIVREMDCDGYYSGPDVEYAYMHKISLDRPVFTDTIIIKILSAKAGTKYSDTCISEIELH